MDIVRELEAHVEEPAPEVAAQELEEGDVPFPMNIVKEINFPTEMDIGYYQQGNIAEAILGLLTGPDVMVYTSMNRDWCLPLTKYEAAMYLLETQHLDFLRQRLIGIPMTDVQFFDLFFLLCAEPGRYKFEPIYNPERFVDMSHEKIYTELTGVKPPRAAYTLTQELRELIYKYLERNLGTVLYYFLMYSRRIIYNAEYLEKLKQIRNRNRVAINYHFTGNPEYAFPQLSIDNNHPAMLMTEYFQFYSPNIPGKYSSTSANLVRGLGLHEPQHKTRRQLVRMYKYFREDIPGKSLPHFIVTRRDDIPDVRITIEYLDDLRNINIVDKSIYQSDGYFTYYVSALTSKMKSKTDQSGQLDVLTSIYNNYKYSIEFLYRLTYINTFEYKKFLEGLAAYHLLYQCMTGRTSKYLDGPKQNLSEKPMLETLRQIIEKCARSCSLLRVIPFYRGTEVVQRAYPLRDVLSELNEGYSETDEIDDTIGIICDVLGADDAEYARVINRITHKLRLREHYGVIKTKFNRPEEEIDEAHIERLYKRMNLIADFQGRNVLIIADADYDQINARLVLEDTIDEDYDEDGTENGENGE